MRDAVEWEFVSHKRQIKIAHGTRVNLVSKLNKEYLHLIRERGMGLDNRTKVKDKMKRRIEKESD